MAPPVDVLTHDDGEERRAKSEVRGFLHLIFSRRENSSGDAAVTYVTVTQARRAQKSVNYVLSSIGCNHFESLQTPRHFGNEQGAFREQTMKENDMGNSGGPVELIANPIHNLLALALLS